MTTTGTNQLLVGICRELQRRAGDAPFFLGCRTAAELLGVEHNTAARWLPGAAGNGRDPRD